MRRLGIIDYMAICGFIILNIAVFVFYRFDSIESSIQARHSVNDLQYHAVIATKGVSAILKELSRFGLYEIVIPEQTIKNPNSKLFTNYIQSNNSYRFLVDAKQPLENKETLGSITYNAKIALFGYCKFLFFYCLIYVIFKLFNLAFISLAIEKIYQCIEKCFETCFGHFVAMFYSFNFSKKHAIFFILLIVLCVLLRCISIFDSIVMREGWQYTHFNDSSDMQWYPSVHYWGFHGFSSTNPYAEALAGNVFLANAPNYGHLLYILMAPFAFFSYDTAKVLWAIFNNICIFIALYYVMKVMIDKISYKMQESIPNAAFGDDFCKKFAIGIFLCVILLFFQSQIYAMSIYRGNIPLVLCLFFVLAYVYRSNFFILTICLAVICVKYTFGVPLMLGFLFAGYWRAVFAAGFIHLCVVALFALQFNTGFIEMLLLAPKVGSTLASSMSVDFMTLARTNGGFTFLNPFFHVIIFCLLLWFFTLYKTKANVEQILLSSFAISLCLFQHHAYDYVMLIAGFLLAFCAFRLTSVHFVLYCFFMLFVFLSRDYSLYELTKKQAILFASLVYCYALFILVKSDNKTDCKQVL